MSMAEDEKPQDAQEEATTLEDALDLLNAPLDSLSIKDVPRVFAAMDKALRANLTPEDLAALEAKDRALAGFLGHITDAMANVTPDERAHADAYAEAQNLPLSEMSIYDIPAPLQEYLANSSPAELLGLLQSAGSLPSVMMGDMEDIQALESLTKSIDEGGWAPRSDDIQTVREAEDTSDLPDMLIEGLNALKKQRENLERAVRVFEKGRSVAWTASVMAAPAGIDGPAAMLMRAVGGNPAPDTPPEVAEQMRIHVAETAEAVANARELVREIAAGLAELYAVMADGIRLWRAGKPLALPPSPDTLSHISVYTSEDMSHYMRAQCAGMSGDGWTVREEDGHMVWNPPGARYFITVPPAIKGGLSAADLVSLQSVDSAWAILYALNVLLNVGTPTAHSVPVVTLDIDDVIEKTRGYVPTRREDLKEARREVWLALLYGDLATITGKRSIPYYDERGGEAIDTELSGPLFRLEWQIDRRGHRRGQTSIVTRDTPAVPYRIGYMLTRPAYAVLSHAKLIQYLPMAELLGGIPGGKPSGDWARAIGLTLFTEWRKHPGLNGNLNRRRPLTRRELLYTFRPRTNPDDILCGSNPSRAVEYFQEALGFLVEAKILKPAADVALDAKEIRADLPRYGWKDTWLDAPVRLSPSPALSTAIKEAAERLPPPRKPKELGPKKPRSRKRPASDGSGANSREGDDG